MKQEGTMAVCRRSRALKLTVFGVLVFLLLNFIFPDEVHGFMSEFIPPQQQPHGSDEHHHRHDQDRGGAHQNLIKKAKAPAARSEHVPYLTPGNPGNFEPLRDEDEKGPGEKGVPHHTKPSQSDEVDQAINEYGMNMVASKEISLDRSVPDTRLPQCKDWHYPTELPKASVVIVFHNEGWSVLMRTVHSVINRTPGQFLEEVLLVDDFSDKSDLGVGLERYIKIFRGMVRLVRNTEREGLIRSRSRGAREARGVVLVFLDAHCEVNKNWLPPLLAPIYRDYTTMTVPIIDGVDHETFEYRPVYQGEEHFRGIFEWGMLYKETELPEDEAAKREHNSEPYPSPTHAGGLFAINRQYFLTLGAYDPGLLVWGGENFELSFKIWQCGGSIVWVPCSRVGHVYRAFMPYGFGKLTEKAKGPVITINYKRVVEVWMDEEYKEFFYTREPTARYADMGNITAQLALKKELECKTFDWFIKNVAPDMLKKFPKLPPNTQLGSLVNMVTRSCLDTLGRAAPSQMGASPCSGQGNNQLMRLNSKGQLGIGERCVDATKAGVQQIFCPSGSVSGPWSYKEDTGQLVHSRGKRCLTAQGDQESLSLDKCKSSDEKQKWVFKENKPRWAVK